ncbi:MAG: hypothetical protein ACI4SG_00725 [Oligosphaeraceae bacterium]
MKQEVNIVFVADTEEASKAIENSTEAIKDLNEETKQASSNVSKGLSNIARTSKNAARTLEQAVSKQTASLDNLTKSGADATKSIKDISASIDTIEKRSSLRTKISDFFNFQALPELAKKAAAAIWGVVKNLASIGEQADKIGTTSRYFQQLTKTAEETGVSVDDIGKCFSHLKKQAASAAAGNEEAASAFAQVGLSIDKIRTLSPEQLFESVTGALGYMGESAASDTARMHLLGDASRNLAGHLKEISNSSNVLDGIFSDSSVRSAQTLSEATKGLGNAMSELVSALHVPEGLAWCAKVLKEAAEEMKALTDKKATDPAAHYKTWNNTNVSEENRRRAEEIDREVYRKQINPHLYKAYTRKELDIDNMPIEDLRRVLQKDENGLTPGQAANMASKENPWGYKHYMASASATKEEIQEQNAKRIANLRKKPFAGTEKVAPLINEFEQELAQKAEGTINALSRDWNTEIDKALKEAAKEAEAKAVAEETAEKLKPQYEKTREAHAREIKALRDRAGSNQEALDKIAELEKRYKQEDDEAEARAKNTPVNSQPSATSPRPVPYIPSSHPIRRRPIHILSLKERAIRDGEDSEAYNAYVAKYPYMKEEVNRIIAKKAAKTGASTPPPPSPSEAVEKEGNAGGEAIKEGTAAIARQGPALPGDLYTQAIKAVSMASMRSEALLERIAKASENSVYVVRK